MVLAWSLGQIAGGGYTARRGTRKLPTNFEREKHLPAFQHSSVVSNHW